MKPRLVLLPNFIGEEPSSKDFFPENLPHEIQQLEGLIAESEKSGRKYLCLFLSKERANSLPIFLLNEHTNADELNNFFEKKFKGYWGLISDSGLPCLADPGSKIVALCRSHGLEVKVISGPSAIVMALLLSGFCAQKFTFHGYLPRDEKELIEKIKRVEKDSQLFGYTQIFIEAPYRSDKLLKNLLLTLNERTYLSLAVALTTSEQRINTFKVKKWRELDFSITKKPTVFLISSQM